jgi:hypothetical protein
MAISSVDASWHVAMNGRGDPLGVVIAIAADGGISTCVYCAPDFRSEIQSMTASTSTGGKPPAIVVQDLLGQYMGPFTSKHAVQIVSRQALSREPDGVTLDQIPALLEGLGPALRTLLGKASAEKLAGQIRLELGL